MSTVKEKSELQKLPKTHTLYKEAIKIKKLVEKSGKSLKVREVKGVFHVLDKTGYSLVNGSTQQIALENAYVLQAIANLSASVWKQELRGV